MVDEHQEEVRFRIYKDSSGEVHLAQIVDGVVYELEPNEEDKKRAPGLYDADFNLVSKET
jgi:hypothetical protein